MYKKTNPKSIKRKLPDISSGSVPAPMRTYRFKTAALVDVPCTAKNSEDIELLGSFLV